MAEGEGPDYSNVLSIHLPSKSSLRPCRQETRPAPCPRGIPPEQHQRALSELYFSILTIRYRANLFREESGGSIDGIFCCPVRGVGLLYKGIGEPAQPKTNGRRHRLCLRLPRISQARKSVASSTASRDSSPKIITLARELQLHACTISLLSLTNFSIVRVSVVRAVDPVF